MPEYIDLEEFADDLSRNGQGGEMINFDEEDEA